MAEGRTMSVSYVVNSGEFNKNISAMKKNLSLLEQEVKNSAKDIVNSGNTFQNLISKHKNLGDAIDKTKEIIKKYNDSLKKNTEKLEEQKSKLQEINNSREKAQQTYQKMVAQYGKESEEAKKAADAVKKLDEEYANQEKAISKTSNAVQSNMSEIAKMEGKQKDLEGQLKATNEEIERQSNKMIDLSQKFVSAGQKLQDAGGKISDLGGQVQQVGGVITGLSTALATLAADYESGLAKIQSIGNYSVDELADVKEQIMQISNDTGTTLGDLTEAGYQALSASVDKSKMTDFLAQMDKLSTGGFTDITTAVDLVTTAINAYGLSADNAGEISDKLIQTQNLGKTSVAELGSSMGKVIPTAKAYGVNLDQLCTYLAESTAQGVATAESVTYVNSAFNELGDSGSTVGTILKEKTGKTFKELMENGANLSDVMLILNQAAAEQGIQFGELWGSAEAGKAGLAILTDEGTKFNGILEQMKNSTGSTEKAFKTMSETTEYKFKKSLNQLKNSATKLGESLLPLADKLAEGIEKLADYIGELNPEIVVGIAKFGLFAIAIGTVMKVVGGLVTTLGKGVSAIGGLFKIAADTKSLGSLSAALTASNSSAGALIGTLGKFAAGTGPVGLAVAAVAGLTGALIANYAEVKKGEEKLKGLGGTFDDFTGKVRTNSSIWSEIFGTEYTIKFSDNYKQALSNSLADVENWVETIKGYQEQINKILNDTQKTEEVKDKELSQLTDTQHMSGMSTSQQFSLDSFMSGKGYSDADIKAYQSKLYKALDETADAYNKNADEINAIIKDEYAKYGELTESGLDKIKKLKEENANYETSLQTKNGEDLLKIVDEYQLKQQNVANKYSDNSVEKVKKEAMAVQSAQRDKLQAQLDYFNQLKPVNEEEAKMRQESIDRISAELVAEDEKTNRLVAGNLLRAASDKTYADQHEISIQKVKDDELGAITQIIDNNGLLQMTMVSNQEALEKYAAYHDGTMQQIKGEHGEMVNVVVDGEGNIIACVQDAETAYALYGEQVDSTLNNFIEQNNLAGATAEEQFSAICKAIDDGTLSAEQFGMTKDDFKNVASEIYGAGNQADTASGKVKNLSDNMDRVPKHVESEVNIYGIDEANSKSQSLLDKLGSLAGKVWQTAVSVVTGKTTGNALGGTTPGGFSLVNERGIETLATGSANLIGSVVDGDLAYTKAGSQVNTAMLTEIKMSNMINSRIARTMQAQSINFQNAMLQALNKAAPDRNGNIIVTIQNANFTDKQSTDKNLNQIKSIVLSAVR